VDEIIKYSRIPLAIAFFVALLDLPYGIHKYKNEEETWSYF